MIALDIPAFLRDDWQQRPRLIRGAFPDWQNPLDPDELAGLAGEADVESRLIVRAEEAWGVEHGPIPDTRFGGLQRQPWTLLVQAVDQHVPEVAALIEPFRFIPDWRIDDVMVSYASDGGGVGAHFDQYDVFLIQGLGRRRWRVGERCDASTALLPHDDLKLLADFVATDEWLLEPGDMLYVPPGFAHDGVAVGDDCMTYSIGFRAPAVSELVAHWCDHVLAGLSDDDRYADPGLSQQANPGEISPEALDRLHEMISARLADRADFARWFGGYTTLPKYPEIDWSPDGDVSPDAIAAALAQGATLERNPAMRFAFVREGDGVLLYVDGDEHRCAGPLARLAEQLCAGGTINIAPALASETSVIALIGELIGQGALRFGD